MNRYSRLAGLGLCAAAMASCGDEAGTISGPDSENLEPTKVLALSTYDASVGTLVEALATNIPDPRKGDVSLIFRGDFHTTNGGIEPVDIAVPAEPSGPGTLKWTGFGPFRNPFSSTGNEIGTYVGTIHSSVRMKDGTIIEDTDPLPITFIVRPSILVHELQPVSASCGGPVRRGLGGASYRLRVEAIGFMPATFTYSLATPQAGEQSVTLKHLASGPFDTVGTLSDFNLPPVPAGVQSYGAILSVQARTREGLSFQNTFGITVHRPLELYYNGNVSVAEVMAPVPVSGCIPGGETGRRVEYTEAQTETRARDYNINWNESWLNTHTVEQGSQETIGLSEQNGVGFSTTDGSSFNWSMGTEVSGSLSLFDLVELGVGANQSQGGNQSTQTEQSENRTVGVNESTTTTETESFSASQSGQIGESFSWQVSSSDSIARGFGGTVIPGTFGVFYRQTLRLLRRAAVVTYNQCGAATVVADVDFSDWAWSPDLSLGSACPPLPDSNLPGAECLIPPCQGE